MQKCPDLRELAQHFKDHLLPIKVCAFDVDGILTDGTVRYDGSEMGFNRNTHTRDGYGFKMLMEAGIKVGIISGGNSLGLTKRFVENLNLDFVYTGNEDKRESYNKILEQGFCDQEILYMGDEFFDLPLLKRCGFSATVATASLEIQEAVNYITWGQAGMGCAREVMDILRYAQNIIPNVPDF